MRAGQLRHHVEIQIASESRTGHGAVDRAWTVEAERWASISPLQGQEQILAQQLGSRMSHRIQLRYYAGLTTKHRIVHDGRVFEIRSVANVGERDKSTECMVEEQA